MTWPRIAQIVSSLAANSVTTRTILDENEQRNLLKLLLKGQKQAVRRLPPITILSTCFSAPFPSMIPAVCNCHAPPAEVAVPSA